MRGRSLALVAALILLPLRAAPAGPQSASAPALAPPLLRLHRGTFDARAGVTHTPTSAWAATAPGPYAIVQFHEPATPADRAGLSAAGVALIEYLPDFAYVVRGTEAQLEAASQLPRLYARTSFTLADKLAPSLLRGLARGDADVGRVRLVGWPGGTGAGDLAKLGLTSPVDATAAELLAWARLEAVRWIEPASQPRLLNDFARAIMQVDPAWESHGLLGAGQIVGVADSGLDTGDLLTLSPDFAGRIAATHVLSATGDWADGHGHGTHVAGSIGGSGVLSGANPAAQQYAGSFAGVAPEASLVIQGFEVDATTGAISGLPDDFYTLFDQAYADGARLHSDSWGDYTGPVDDLEASFGGYPYGAQRADQFVWDHPEMAVFVAAGNSGTDGVRNGFVCTGSDGVIDPDSLLSPGTAKNVITVGASESDRSTGGFGPIPWIFLGLLVGPCFEAAPIATDPLANNAGGMAAFSSRGPTDDGRFKPDLVAPGTNIVSALSHAPGATTLWGVHESNADYAYSGGTSMATPLAAGLGALAREWLVKQGLASPSAALLKALLLNTTHDMAPGQYGTGATQEIPNARPNTVTGWGRADLGFLNAAAPYGLWLDDRAAGLSTGETVTYTHVFSRPLEVVSSALPLRVLLAWTDPPASLSAAAQLVNDLDLVVTGPGGETYPGNSVLAGDRVNNVEGVLLASPAPGLYMVTVSAFNVALDTQPYALAVAGPLVSPASLTPSFYVPLILR